MPGNRVLWTGPYGAAARDLAASSASLEPSGLWLSASPMARDQVRRELAIRARSARVVGFPRVWCWEELWAGVREGAADGPVCLSDAAAVAVFGEAIRQARQAGELDAVASVIDYPGYRGRLRRRFAAWTVDERNPRSRPPADPVAAAEWAAFLRYRGLLRQLGAEDAEGLAAWASRRLLQRPPAALSTFAEVTLADWESPTRAQWRVLDHALRRGRTVRVTLACEGDAESAPIYEAAVGVRDRLIGLGFAEVPVRPGIWRPGGLRELEQSLFRRSGVAVGSAQGLTIEGAPTGEGCARVLARAVRDRLDAGADPEDVLVLFRRWGEPAEIGLEVLRDWGIPAHAEPARPPGADPAVAALLLAIGLPVDDWATDRLIRLLRNGQVRPGWPGSEPISMAAAASVVKASPIFRGREVLLQWLDRQLDEQQAPTVKAGRTRLARDLVARIFAILAPLDQPRPFAEQVERLFGAAGRSGSAAAGRTPPASSGSATPWRIRPASWSSSGAANRRGPGWRSSPRSNPSRWSRQLTPRPLHPAPCGWRRLTTPRAPGRPRDPGRPRRGDLPDPRGRRAVPGDPARGDARRVRRAAPSPERCCDSSGSSGPPSPRWCSSTRRPTPGGRTCSAPGSSTS